MCFKTSVTPSEMVFVAPRAAPANVATVTIRHEYVSSTIPTMTLTYSDTGTVLSGSASTLDNLASGETIQLDGNFDCSGASVEFVEAKDPCAVGAHMCHSKADCTPTDDGLDYTCECWRDADSWNADTGVYENHWGYGNGKECYKFERRGMNFYADLEGFCESEDRQNIPYDIDSPAKEEYFKEYLKWIENFNGRGKIFYSQILNQFCFFESNYFFKKLKSN